MLGRSNMDSWGPAGWTFLHALTFAYPNDPSPQRRQAAFDLLHALGQLLPCERCARHWSTHVSETLATPESEHLQSRTHLSRYIVDAHNRVNRLLGKPVVPYTTVRDWYDPQLKRAHVGGEPVLVPLLLVVVVVLWLTTVAMSPERGAGTTRGARTACGAAR